MQQTKHNTQIPLADLPIGQTAIITAVTDSPMRRHMLEMGLVNGTPVSVIKKAPFGDPLELFFRGYAMLIRKQDAKTIQVIPL